MTRPTRTVTTIASGRLARSARSAASSRELPRGSLRSRPHSSRLALALVTGALSLAACGGKSSGGAPPPQPANGAPIAFVVTRFKAGTERDGTIDVKGYNFSDKKIASYTLAARFTDAGGAVLKVGVGTPFEKENAWTSMSGRRYMCNPKSWCSFEISMMEVPAATAKAEVALTGAHAVGADGMKIEEAAVWESPKGMSDWPL